MCQTESYHDVIVSFYLVKARDAPLKQAVIESTPRNDRLLADDMSYVGTPHCICIDICRVKIYKY